MYNNGLLVGGGYAFTSTNSVGAEVRRNFGVLTLSFPILHRTMDAEDMWYLLHRPGLTPS